MPHPKTTPVQNDNNAPLSKITIEDIKSLAQKSFHILKPCTGSKGKFNVSLEMNSYIELHFFVLDVVKLSLAALDADNENVTNVRNLNTAVRGVLEILLQLVPLEEMQLLDKIHELVAEEERG